MIAGGSSGRAALAILTATRAGFDVAIERVAYDAEAVAAEVLAAGR